MRQVLLSPIFKEREPEEQSPLLPKVTEEVSGDRGPVPDSLAPDFRLSSALKYPRDPRLPAPNSESSRLRTKYPQFPHFKSHGCRPFELDHTLACLDFVKLSYE